MIIQTALSPDQVKTLLAEELPDDYILNSVYEIENVLLILKGIKEKVDFFKELKKYRTKSVDEKIIDLEDRSARLRGVVLHTMKKLEPSQKTLNFPSIGAVTRKKSSHKWTVQDEDSLVSFLDSQGYKSEVIHTREVIDSRKLKKVLDNCEEARVDVPGVTKEESGEAISIKYEQKQGIDESTAQTHETLDSLDGLSVDDL